MLATQRAITTIATTISDAMLEVEAMKFQYSCQTVRQGKRPMGEAVNLCQEPAETSTLSTESAAPIP
jgi:hypothetical protein